MHLIDYLKGQNLPEDIELLDGGTADFELIDFLRQSAGMELSGKLQKILPKLAETALSEIVKL